MYRSGRVEGALATAAANCSSSRPRSAGTPCDPVAAQSGTERLEEPVLPEEGGEEGSDRHLLTVARLLRIKGVDRVRDLVAGAAAWPARAGDGHREAAQDECLGKSPVKGIRAEIVLTAEKRLGARARERSRKPVDGLAAVLGGQLPVGERAQVAERVADPGPDLLLGRAAHVVEVDDDGDRNVDAVGPLAPVVVLERGDGRGDAVVGKIRRHRDHGQSCLARRVLRHVERAAAADPDDGVVRALAELVDEPERRGHAPAAHGVDDAVLERRLDLRDDLLAESRADDDGDVAARRDAPVAEEAGQRRDGAVPHLDRERAGDHAG